MGCAVLPTLFSLSISRRRNESGAVAEGEPALEALSGSVTLPLFVKSSASSRGPLQRIEVLRRAGIF